MGPVHHSTAEDPDRSQASGQDELSKLAYAEGMEKELARPGGSPRSSADCAPKTEPFIFGHTDAPGNEESMDVFHDGSSTEGARNVLKELDGHGLGGPDLFRERLGQVCLDDGDVTKVATSGAFLQNSQACGRSIERDDLPTERSEGRADSAGPASEVGEHVGRSKIERLSENRNLDGWKPRSVLSQIRRIVITRKPFAEFELIPRGGVAP